MFLQSLELHGFKSFAHKTKLAFSRGVSAIVGPNGCGKSNVLDAIRWVLGEQSAKALRGGEMADVIFSGSDSLPPVGFAEVSLTFAECERELGTEFHEVKITRRLFRDGKSEYLLNGAGCRLKDIHQLFMDTGIGRTAYSIMEQGKIDLLLSSRPEDRRAVFEEAAGITRYKAQKKEALRKLEATENNLLRLDDILKEVQRQLNSLSRQAAKARRHQEFSAVLRLLETHGADHQYRLLGRERESLSSRVAQLRADQADAEQAAADAENDLAAQQAELAERDEALTGARSRAADVKNRLVQSQARIEFNRERTDEGERLIAKLREEIAAAEEKRDQQQTRLAEADDAERALTAILAAQQGRFDEENTALASLRLRRAQADAAAQRAAQAAAGAEGRVQFLRAEAGRVQAGAESAEQRAAQLTQEIVALGPQRAQAAAALAEARAAHAANARAITALADAAKAADAAHAEAQRSAQSADQARSGVQRQGAALGSRLDILRQLNLEGEGLDAGAKALLKGLDRPDFYRPAIVGALAALIEVEPKYLPAIEAALAENLQAVLLRDPEIAALALQTLRERQLGKVGVAPIGDEEGKGKIEDGRKSADAAHSERGAHAPRVPKAAPPPKSSTAESSFSDDPPGEAPAEAREARALPGAGRSPALSHVRASHPAALPLLRALLGETLIADNFESALRLRAEHPQSDIATLAGELLTRTGIWRGGQSKGGQPSGAVALLQRRAQIAELEQQTAALNVALAAAEAELTSAQDRAAAAQAAAQEARAGLQAAQIQASELGARASLAEREERDLVRLEDVLRREQAESHRRAQAGRERASTLDAELRAAAEAAAQAQGAIGDARRDAEELRRQENERGEHLAELRARLAAEQRGRDDLSRQRAELRARRDEWAGILAERSRELERYEARLVHYETEIAALAATVESAERELAEAGAECEKLALARMNVASVIGDLESGARAHRRETAVLHEQRGELEVQGTQARLRQEALAEKISQKYQLDLAGFVPDPETFARTLAERRGKGAPPPAGEPWAEAEEAVAQLSERVAGLGAVNLDAIAEHDELEERHRFLGAQRDDLVRSRDELQGIIAKINAVTLELFTATFERVRGNFQEMFAELFGGGRANLLLANESDPLESGIEIVARPPGKQLQSVSLLSGGEKTMTAVALLFSIYMVKPSPFCVLDEMDAPLDESNIGRFIRVLDRFVEQSQFLVITHNKRTIARADVLYGVTMEQPGVSKPVAVRLGPDPAAPAPGPNGHAAATSARATTPAPPAAAAMSV